MKAAFITLLVVAALVEAAHWIAASAEDKPSWLAKLNRVRYGLLVLLAIAFVWYAAVRMLAM